MKIRAAAEESGEVSQRACQEMLYSYRGVRGGITAGLSGKALQLPRSQGRCRSGPVRKCAGSGSGSGSGSALIHDAFEVHHVLLSLQ